MNQALFDSLRAALRGEMVPEASLSACTTWRVGGPAELLIVPADRDDLRQALALLAASGTPWLVIGAGSNLLVKDGGVRGAVLKLSRLREVTFGEDGLVTAEGGLPLMSLIRGCVERGLAGLERLAGIPGTLGGGIAMNAGAGGQQLSEVVTTVTLTGPEGEEEWPAERFDFGYRRCRLPAGRVVTAARLALHSADREALLGEVEGRIAHRRQAHRVGGPNAGSVFKNPPGGQAWELIDRAGLRGMRIGGAEIATRHTNFIVNRGGATAADILALIDLTRRRVREGAGIELETEVRIVGEDR